MEVPEGCRAWWASDPAPTADVLMTDGTGEPSGTRQIGWDALSFGYAVTV